MENKFEQLIEYIINDEEDKAKELFHDVVVEKSRDIYEELMQDEELEEAEEAGWVEGGSGGIGQGCKDRCYFATFTRRVRVHSYLLIMKPHQKLIILMLISIIKIAILYSKKYCKLIKFVVFV